MSGVELDPSELAFRRPFTREVQQTLRIRNPNHEPVAFKVKTTAPKQYCVRPNSGRIEAGQEVEVQVLLQAMQEEPAENFRCRDKFLVQSVAIAANRETMNVQQVWQLVEQNEKSSIQERKIRVVWLPPSDGTAAAPAAGDRSFEASPPAYETPGHRGASAEMSTPTPGTRSSNPSIPQTMHEASSGPNNAAEIAALKTRIAELEKQLQEEGLRQRKTAGVAADAKGRLAAGSMGMTTHPPEGIPVQVCAGLCLVAFLIAWFFF